MTHVDDDTFLSEEEVDDTCTYLLDIATSDCDHWPLNLTDIVDESIGATFRCDEATVDICDTLSLVTDDYFDACYNSTHAYAECALQIAFPDCDLHKTNTADICPILIPQDSRTQWQEDYMRLFVAFSVIAIVVCLDYCCCDGGLLCCFKKCFGNDDSSSNSNCQKGSDDDDDDDDDDLEEGGNNKNQKKDKTHNDDHSTKSTDSSPPESPPTSTTRLTTTTTTTTSITAITPSSTTRIISDASKEEDEEETENKTPREKQKTPPTPPPSTEKIADLKQRRNSIEVWYEDFRANSNHSARNGGVNDEDDASSIESSFVDFGEEDMEDMVEEEEEDYEGDLTTITSAAAYLRRDSEKDLLPTTALASVSAQSGGSSRERRRSVEQWFEENFSTNKQQSPKRPTTNRRSRSCTDLDIESAGTNDENDEKAVAEGSALSSSSPYVATTRHHSLRDIDEAIADDYELPMKPPSNPQLRDSFIKLNVNLGDIKDDDDNEGED